MFSVWAALWQAVVYGTPTSFPWGIQYGSNSHAYHQHVQEQLIPLANNLSLAIHPVALYEIIGCLIVILILNSVKKYLKVPGNLFLTSLGLYGAVRFITEFFRATTFGEKIPNELTIVQLTILILLQLIAFLILYRERKFKNSSPLIEKPVSDKYALVYFLGISLTFLIVSKWLTALEIITLNLVMLPTLFFISWQLFKSITVPAMRLNTLALMVGSLLMMSQTLPEKTSSDSTRFSYNIVSIGTMVSNGQFQFTDANNDCYGGGSTNTYDMKEAAQMKGFGYTRVEQKGQNNVLQYGIDGYWGSHVETVDGIETANIPIVGVRPYFQYDWKLIGMGLGLHLGTMSQLTGPQYSSSTTPTAVREINAYPSAYFRVGYVDHVFGEIKLGQQFPSPFPALGFQTSLGIGFKNNNGGAFRIGTASRAGLVLSPSFPLGRHFILEPLVAGFPGLFSAAFNGGGDDKFEQKSGFTGSLSLRYKFGRNLKRAN